MRDVQSAVKAALKDYETRAKSSKARKWLSSCSSRVKYYEGKSLPLVGKSRSLTYPQPSSTHWRSTTPSSRRWHGARSSFSSQWEVLMHSHGQVG